MLAYLSKSLVRQFNMIIALSISVGILIVAVLASYLSYQKITSDQRTKLANTMELAKLSLQEPIWNMNSSAISDVRDAMMLDTDIIAVKITDETNIVLSERKVRTYSSLSFEELEVKKKFRLWTVKVRRQDRLIGEAHIITSNQDAITLVVKLIILIATAAVVSIILLGLLIQVLGSRFLTKPVNELTATAMDLSKGNLEVHINTSRKDELGVLADSLSYMRDAVREKIKEMAYVNENLEKLIKLRTGELREANIKLQEAKIVAEIANESKSDFLQNISHELRTPMHAILGFAKLTISKIGIINEDKLLEYQDEIISAGNRLSSLIDTLLELSRMETGSTRFQFEPTRLSSIISNSVIEVETYARKKDIKIQYKSKKSDIAVTLDTEKITQVIRNILMNAIKYSPSGEQVFILHEIGEATSRVSIEDKGIGIPENELETVFDIFNQSTKTKTGAGGTGLGLSICKRIIDKHNGRIWAENNSNGGATIIFIVPNNRDNILGRPET